ncbi:MAG TPA: copper resistance protein B [Sphingomicrobium sp.]|nr:copper resistance protein B [Sphingomicrobium sp.]
MTSLQTLAKFVAAASILAAMPVAAQGQTQPAGSSVPAAGATCAPEHAAMGHCTPTPAEKAVPPPSRPVPRSEPTCLPEHAAMGHCKLPEAQPAAQPQPASPPQTACLPEHAAMGHCTAPTPQPAPPGPSTCLPEHAAMGHCTPSPATAAEGTNLPAGSAPPPPVPTDHAGDAVYGVPAMESGRHHLNKFHGGQSLYQVMLNVAEAQFRKGRDGFEWDGEGWYGGDINRLWLKSEGERAFGRSPEKAEIQALYSRAIGPYFNIQGGLRYDFKPDPSRIYAVAGFEGLAPSFFETEGAVFLSSKGELMARLEGYYDQRLTQRLILQPRAELNFAAQSSREIGVGKGLSDAELGLRLRYDIRREFAPYLGLQYRRAFGDTRRFLRDEGEKAGGWSVLTGIRMWF